ncbi:MAG: type II secretion system protein M [Gammaproteobacteria bacterium]|nr:type II secretion system protein M [Gammaproteobacteria bacterium]
MIKQRWEQLSSREQLMVTLMTIVVCISLFYFIIWEPLQVGIKDGHTRHKAQTEALITMQQQAAEAQALRSSGAGKQASVRDSSSLLSLIERTAKQQQLQNALQKVQPDGKDGVRVWMDNAPFDQVIQWLSTLTTQHGIFITEISFERQDAPGLVNSRILLRVNP